MSHDKARAMIGVVWEMAGDVRQCDWASPMGSRPAEKDPVQVNDAPPSISILPITTLDRTSNGLRVPGICMNDQVVTANRPDRPPASLA